MQRVSLLVALQCEGIFMSWQKFHHIILPKPDFAHTIRLRADVPKLIALYQDGRFKLEELITKRYPLEEINEAVSAVKRGEALRNVIVI